jgi:hypothetical protein
MKKGDKVFLRLPKEGPPPKGVLHSGSVLNLENEACRIQLDEPCPGFEESSDALLHFEEKRKFMQQSVRLMHKDSEEPLIVTVQLQGTPVSAESRQCFRVSCLGLNIKATVADEPRCEVVDISATGFAFYGTREHAIGSRVRVTLVYEGKEYSGQGTVQSSRRMTPRLLRHGIHCGDVGKDTLAKSLSSINLDVQQAQLRRLAAKS